MLINKMYVNKRSLNCKIGKVSFIIGLFLIIILTTQIVTTNIKVNSNNKKNISKINTFSNFKENKEIMKTKFSNFETTRSHVDKKKYFAYTLPSGLEVIIIQDTNLKVAGATMTVNSGVNKEGKDIYGLAHYCEHMLFLGSKKYNKPTYFVDYITQHNGKFNGFTDFSTTGFFFKINSEKFKHALDIFSRFFIDPLFSAEYVKKEVNSVNSEYERNIQVDGKRKEMILREIADVDSLFHRFSTGNTNTLWNFTEEKKIDLRERVLEYYRINYRPDNMKLIIYGDEKIEKYKDLVDDLFGDMKKREDPYNPLILANWTKMPWEVNKIGKVVLFKTINNHQELDITFIIEDIFKTLPHNPALYYKVLLNYRGKGSLDDVLRSRGLVAGIKANARKTYKGFSMFKIRGYVTKYGIKHLDQIIGVIFKYIKYVRQRALNQELYDYIKRVFDTAFFFMNKKMKTTKYLKSWCHTVWNYHKKFYFVQHKTLGIYDKEVIQKFGEKLQLKNAIIMIGNKEFDEKTVKNYGKYLEGFDEVIKNNTSSTKESDSNQNNDLTSVILNKKDPFYFTQYAQFQIKKEIVQFIDREIDNVDNNNKNVNNENKTSNFRKEQTAPHANNSKTNLVQTISTTPATLNNSAFSPKMPKLHVFTIKRKLPKIISLIRTCKPDDKKQCAKDFRKDGEDLTPKIIKKTESFELWHKHDRSFLVAKSDFFIKFIFDFDVNNPTIATKLRLLIYAFNHHLRNFFFEESLRQNSFNLNASANGFSAKIFSFSETLKETSKGFFKKLKTLKLNQSQFELVKDEMKSQIKAQMNLVPALKAYVNFFTLILKDYVEYEVILQELDKLQLKDFHNFYENLFEKMYIKSFIHGSVDKNEAVEIFEDIFKLFNDNGQVKFIKNSEIQNYINPHSNLSGYYIFREKLNNSYNINHAVLNFYQIGKENIKNMINANLVKALCGYIYFTQLRIKEQLGYTARAKIFSEGNVIYYMIVVQGSKKTPDFMDLRIENVIGLMRERILGASEAKFNKFKKLVARKIGRRDKNIKNRSFRLWNEIITRRNYFNIKPIAKEYVSLLSKDDILEFFDNMVEKSLKKLSIQEFSKKAKKVPKSTPTIRGYKSVLIKHYNDLRNKNKYLE